MKKFDPTKVETSDDKSEDLLKHLNEKLRSDLKSQNAEITKDFSPKEDNEENKTYESNRVYETSNENEFMRMGEVAAKNLRKVSRVLPHWLKNPETINQDIVNGSCKIEQLNDLHPNLLKALKSHGIHTFFPVQRTIIPRILLEASKVNIMPPSDFCISAATGSGKTLSYVLPILNLLIEARAYGFINVLVVLPTEVLANQILKVFKEYAEFLSNYNIKVGSAIGSNRFQDEQKNLTQSRKSRGVSTPNIPKFESLVDIVVGTPARIRMHMKNTPGFDISRLRFLVFDEVDELLATGEAVWLQSLARSIASTRNQMEYTIPHLVPPPYQKILVSATLSRQPEHLAALELYNPVLFTTKGKELSDGKASARTLRVNPMVCARPTGLKERYVTVEQNIQPLVVHHLVLTKKWTGVLVFLNSRNEVHRLYTLLSTLSEGRYSVEEFSSKVSKNPAKIAARFNKGAIDVLVATDNLARGVDFEGCRVVINYSMPADLDTYTHRIGRTARAGRDGLALTMLLSHMNREKFVFRMKKFGATAISAMPVYQKDLDVYTEKYQNALTSLQEKMSEEKTDLKEDKKQAKYGSENQKRKGAGHKRKEAENEKKEAETNKKIRLDRQE